MATKIYYLSSEVAPFSEATDLAKISNKVPSYFQEKKQDFRIFTPRYGFVSERRYIIREVIRLKEIEVEYKGEMTYGAAKSAFVPSTKVQVYFMEYQPYFGGKNKTLYKVAENRYNQRNAEKYFYFSKIAIENLTYLYWQPDYIMCNDWTTAMVPVLLKTIYAEEEFFTDMKTVLNLVNIGEMGLVAKKQYEMAGLAPEDYAGYENDLLGLAIKHADEIISISIDGKDNKQEIEGHENIQKALKASGKKVKYFTISDESDEDWQQLNFELETFFGVEY
ncbi:MAG: glycogen/starch synthase [Candidatus Marinimicrobia bacterium]|nr:glycogen/starch synthase [Candidatus Neomarinimicrobiota bacterium]